MRQGAGVLLGQLVLSIGSKSELASGCTECRVYTESPVWCRNFGLRAGERRSRDWQGYTRIMLAVQHGVMGLRLARILGRLEEGCRPGDRRWSSRHGVPCQGSGLM